MHRQWRAAALTVASVVVACICLQRQQRPAVLFAPGHWENPSPWITDPDDYAKVFNQDGGQLDEFFSEEPGLFARGGGGSYEWPYVWQGDSGSGFDWLGSETSVSSRGLKMPMDHDALGELYPRDGRRSPGFDEVMYRSTLPGGARWPAAAKSGLAARHADAAGAQQREAYAEEVRARAESAAAPLGGGGGGSAAPAAPASAPSSSARGGQERLKVASGGTSLASVYTDYGMSGAGVKCTCDSSAGDDRPACKCTGGRLTKTTHTEQGGPLDTGSKGAWPQNMQNHVDYIDGGSAAAYSAPTTELEQVIRRAPGSLLTEYGLPKGKFHARFRGREPVIKAGPEGLTWDTRDRVAPEVKRGVRSYSAPAHKSFPLPARKSAVGPKDKDKEEKVEEEIERHEEEEARNLSELLADPGLSAHDHRMVMRLSQAFRQFAMEGEACVLGGGPACAFGKMCPCNAAAGQKLCSRVDVEAGAEACEASDKWGKGVCRLPSVVAAKKLCSSKISDVLRGVNIDNDLFDDHLDDARVVHPAEFFLPQPGVHN